jgi:hypothetical protein
MLRSRARRASLCYPRDELIGQRVEVLVPVSARQLHPAHRGAYMADTSPAADGRGNRPGRPPPRRQRAAD